MAVTFTYGTVGSGKTYRLVRDTLRVLQDGRAVATINLVLRSEQVLAYLRGRGMDVYTANRAVARITPVWTSPQFRGLRDCYLGVDEAHFWWPQNQYRKIDLEDILTAAMSRKRKVDLHVISQLEKSVNQNVRDLAIESWLARPLIVEPFYSGLKILSRLARALSMPGLNRPAAFYYTRVTDALGTTATRRDGTVGAGDKELVFLDPALAACYDTLQEVSSPILDELRDQSRQAYLLAVARGETRPQLACAACGGSRTWRYLEVPRWDAAGRCSLVRVPFDEAELRQNMFARSGVDDCPICDDGTGPRGYTYPAEHPDYDAARALMEQVRALGGRRGAN